MAGRASKVIHSEDQTRPLSRVRCAFSDGRVTRTVLGGFLGGDSGERWQSGRGESGSAWAMMDRIDSSRSALGRLRSAYEIFG